MNDINIKILEDAEFEEDFLNMKLVDMYCKYKTTRNTINWKMNYRCPGDIYCHLGVIQKMEQYNYNPIIRIVICKYDFCSKPIIWIDNLHGAIKYIREYGEEAKLKDIPFYVVDLTDLENPIIKGYKNSLRQNISDVLGAVSKAYFTYDMSNSKELINEEYLVKDLLSDNMLLYLYNNKYF